MKILSKYKDYYDYLSGIWGEDPKLVLDRRKGNPKPIGEKYDFQLKDTGKIKLIICGKLIEGYRHQNKIYYGEDIKQFSNIDNSKWDGIDYPYTTIRTGGNGLRIRDTYYALEPIDDYIHINKKHNCPILIKSGWEGWDEYPKLEELNLGSFINAETIYIWIQEYLAKEIDELQNIPIILNNKEKIISKGFDPKTSFRPNIR
jgi:hypothetical protein